MSNRRARREARRGDLSLGEFSTELTKVVDGTAGTDAGVAAFWRRLNAEGGVVAAVSHPGGIEILRDTPHLDSSRDHEPPAAEGGKA